MERRIQHPGISQRGFTLIELAAVAIVLAVITAMAIPRVTDFLVTQRLEAAARRILVDLALAQRDARFTGISRTVTFDAAADRYQIVGLSSLDDASATYEVVLSDEPYGVDLVSASFGIDGDVIFDAYGVPDSGGTIVLAVGNVQQTIQLDGGTGRALTLPPGSIVAE